MNDQLRRHAGGTPAARSVLLTMLGEYVLSAQQGVWQETLVAALGSLGYKTNAARQALARSATAGWLETVRHGRRARVYLSSDTADMLRTGAERIYSFGGPWEWDGQWLLVIVRVPERQRAVRHQVRTRLAWAGFGSLGGGLWLTPHTEQSRNVAFWPGATQPPSFCRFAPCPERLVNLTELSVRRGISKVSVSPIAISSPGSGDCALGGRERYSSPRL